MSFERPLRGSCACRRNQYFIRAPEGVDEAAQVIFGTDSSHRIAQASPLTAHIRVPLTWYHSATFALFPDETASTIRRVFENPLEGHSRRHFCGYCGTPLTFWTEQPRAERDYLLVTVGSLCREDLGDLEDMGLIPESPHEETPAEAGKTFQVVTKDNSSSTEDAAEPPVATSTAITMRPVGRETTGIPWFESIVEGSSLGGRLKTAKGSRQSADGATRIEWEISEYTEEPGPGGEQTSSGASGNNGKRKLGDRDDMDDAASH